MPPRAGNVSMDSGKLAAALGGNTFRPWPVGEELFPTDRTWHFPRPAGEPGGPEWVAERLYRYPSTPTHSTLAPEGRW